MKGNKSKRRAATIEEARAFHEFLSRRGRANALTSAELAQTFAGGVKDARRWLRRLANVCVRAGLPVCSGDEGYWIASGWEDIDITIRRLSAQRQAITERIEAYQRIGRKTFGKRPDFSPETSIEHGKRSVQDRLL